MASSNVNVSAKKIEIGSDITTTTDCFKKSTSNVDINMNGFRATGDGGNRRLWTIFSRR